MILSHKIALRPNKSQQRMLVKSCGVARFAYNWALDRWNTYYKAGIKVNTNRLDKDFNKCKKILFPWAYEVTKSASQNAIKKNLKNAFDRFFKKKSKYPKFKKKGIRDSYTIDNDRLFVSGKKIRLPKIGQVKMAESLRFQGKIMSATVSRDADRWFISIAVDLGKDYCLPQAFGSVGIDLGIATAIVTSKGDFFDSPKPLKKYEKLLSRRQRQMSRKQKGSNNRSKSRMKLAKCYQKIRNIRQDWIHKITTKIASENQVVILEDLAVSNLMKNHCLARSISDMGWYEIYRQLAYKTKLRKGQVVKIDRFYPSSKTCSSCGQIKSDLKLSDRIFKCDCGYVCDRDLNAAKNIHTVGLTGINACGDGSSGSKKSLNETTVVEAGTKLVALCSLN